MAKNVLTYNLAEPLNDATTAKVDIDAGEVRAVPPREPCGEPFTASSFKSHLP